MNEYNKSDEEIVEEFIEATPHWHDELIKKNEPCIMCGIIPNNLRDLAKALKTLLTSEAQKREEAVREERERIYQVLENLPCHRHGASLPDGSSPSAILWSDIDQALTLTNPTSRDHLPDRPLNNERE